MAWAILYAVLLSTTISYYIFVCLQHILWEF